MPHKAANILLIGPMGAGKSTVGRLLGHRLQLPFLDTDQRIVESTGVSIPTIFEIEGEAGFRQREHKVLASLIDHAPMVLATGGGIVLSAENRALLKQLGVVVFLDVSIAEQLKRVQKDSNRPLLAVSDPRARLEALKSQRDPLYQEVADLRISTDGLRTEQIVQRICAFVRRMFGDQSHKKLID